MFNIGDTVYINDPNESYHGQPGTVITTDSRGSFPYQVRMADGDFWFTAGEVSATDPTASDMPRDFDRGFGVGGLGRHQEPPIVPSAQALERYERKAAKARTCRRCGQSDEFDGAMFITLGGGDICDDCAG